MSMKKVYNCDICRSEREPEKLTGIYFQGMTKFKFDEAESTDGVHICTGCLLQLKSELSVIEFPEKKV